MKREQKNKHETLSFNTPKCAYTHIYIHLKKIDDNLMACERQFITFGFDGDTFVEEF